MWKKIKLLFALALCAFLAMAAIFKESTHTYRVYKNAGLYAIGNASYASNEIKEIYIYWEGGDQCDKVEIEVIEPSQNGIENTITVSESKIKNEDERMRTLLKDGILIVQFCKSGYNIDISECKELRISIPSERLLEKIIVENVAAPISCTGIKAQNATLRTASGIIKIKDCKTEKLNVQTASGLIDITDIWGGKVTVESASGSVELRNCEMQKVSIKTVSGSINTTNFTGNSIMMETTSGSVKLSNCIAQKKVSVKTTSGSIDLSNVQSCHGKIKTTSGNTELSKFSLRDCDINNISGDVILDLGDTQKIENGAYIVFYTRSGNIIAKNDYTTKGDNTYIFGDGTRKINIDTISGSLKIK